MHIVHNLAYLLNFVHAWLKPAFKFSSRAKNARYIGLWKQSFARFPSSRRVDGERPICWRICVAGLGGRGEDRWARVPKLRHPGLDLVEGWGLDREGGRLSGVENCRGGGGGWVDSARAWSNGSARMCASACLCLGCLREYYVRACVRERKIDWFVRSGEPWTAMIP